MTNILSFLSNSERLSAIIFIFLFVGIYLLLFTVWQFFKERIFVIIDNLFSNDDDIFSNLENRTKLVYNIEGARRTLATSFDIPLFFMGILMIIAFYLITLNEWLLFGFLLPASYLLWYFWNAEIKKAQRMTQFMNDFRYNLLLTNDIKKALYQLCFEKTGIIAKALSAYVDGVIEDIDLKDLYQFSKDFDLDLINNVIKNGLSQTNENDKYNHVLISINAIAQNSNKNLQNYQKKSAVLLVVFSLLFILIPLVITVIAVPIQFLNI